MEKNVTESMVYRMFFLGRNFVSSLICTLKSENLKTFPQKPKNFSIKKPRFFPALGARQSRCCSSDQRMSLRNVQTQSPRLNIVRRA